MAVGSVSSAAIPQRSGVDSIVDGAVQGIKMESKWGAVIGGTVGVVGGAAVGMRGGIGGAAVGALAGGAIGAISGVAALFLDGAMNGIGAGIGVAVTNPTDRSGVVNSAAVGAGLLGATVGGISGGAKFGISGVVGGAVIGGLWSGVMGHFIGNRLADG